MQISDSLCLHIIEMLLRSTSKLQFVALLFQFFSESEILTALMDDNGQQKDQHVIKCWSTKPVDFADESASYQEALSKSPDTVSIDLDE